MSGRNVTESGTSYFWAADDGSLIRLAYDVLETCSNGHRYTPDTARIGERGVSCRLCQREADARRGRGRGA